MSLFNKDLIIIKRIEHYCFQIEETVNRFGNSYDVFLQRIMFIKMPVQCAYFKLVNLLGICLRISKLPIMEYRGKI